MHALDSAFFNTYHLSLQARPVLLFNRNLLSNDLILFDGFDNSLPVFTVFVFRYSGASQILRYRDLLLRLSRHGRRALTNGEPVPTRAE